MNTTVEASGGKAQSRRILLVDDNADAALALSMLLEALGHQVCTEHDGPRALASIDEFRPDVVVLDIGLPGMSGFEVAREMRQRQATRDALLLALTGWSSDADRQNALDAGFDYHLTKRVTIADLEAALVRPHAR
ncbi:multi-sensor hybrid histidine kinase [Candidatus Paraburkholderia kirkii UZHbot1]|uniref:Multi-sensor hybrid histidine kinase n=1 Tax=Candidatus Paraburkholderia kirkii UZHbot1 TaxID=1055526 RepID=G4M7G2_9BURK|nr:multi-sensor hybrid histidine kinase [Candidatus Paraburkholderia kirkii UZHbot1]